MLLKPKDNQQLDHNRLITLINSMSDAFIALDEKLGVVLYNGAALNILDVNNIKDGQKIDKLFKPIDKNNQKVALDDLIKISEVSTTNRDLRLEYADGSIINLYLNIAPLRLGYRQKGQRGYVLLLRDITREKSLEEERDEFISVVSHELRTPIAIAEGNISNAQYVSDKGGNLDQVKKALQEAHSQIMFLADMINDLATLSRAERGKLTVEIESINVHDLLNELFTSYKNSAQAKGLELRVDLDPKLELLNSCKLYIREILQNFLTNAIKYTQSGSIVLSAKAKENGVEFEVTDTGIGISKSDQERIFDKFFRSEDYRTRQSNGTGLGLYVTLKLARLINGEITMKSQLNHGSTFAIVVPNLG
ncbi:MAG TPA: ATP-binding protein [Candidatus Dormibacteraeota bacterium]|nr:ATP-binding protein [Candidatus Dormibacteraeota bacterium]